MMKSFEEKHHEKAKLSVGARALAKHSNRSSDGWWGALVVCFLLFSSSFYLFLFIFFYLVNFILFNLFFIFIFIYNLLIILYK